MQLGQSIRRFAAVFTHDIVQPAVAKHLRHDLLVRLPRAVERKEHPLSMRLPETDIAIIDRAASPTNTMCRRLVDQ